MCKIEEMLSAYPEIYQHVLAVMELVTEFAIYIDAFDDRELSIIRTGTLLHDIGKLFVPQNILNKAGKLSKEDFEIIKRHTEFGLNYLISGKPAVERRLTDYEAFQLSKHAEEGYQYLKMAYPCLPEEMLAIVIQHHERVDGTGYPYGIKGDQIHPYAKLVSLCDVYEAITSVRCYKPKYDPDYALKCIDKGLGKQFDEVLGRKFIRFAKDVWIGKNKGNIA